MKPSRDIRIFTHLDERIQLYKAIGVVDPEMLEIFTYKENSILPNPNWIDNTIEPIKKQHSRFEEFGMNIFFGKMKTEFISTLQQLDFGTCNDRREVYDYFKNNEPLSIRINNQISEFIQSKIFHNCRDIVFHNLISSDFGKPSLNFELLGNGFYHHTGLHIDRSELLELGNFHLSRQRICINLGETRYLYFSPYSADSLVNEFKQLKTDITFEDILEMYKVHLRDEPIYVLPIPRGYYYIAPTDNVIHDGSSVHHKTFDVACVYLGHFNVFCENELLYF
jgi:hypothetical protein